ncbi:VOC family protein [Agaribacter marinus]|uniref:Glyoxalase n=1 Tax=Agaribacter marinus TaxID=1431249 RepID=A0AA37WI33_9ALTE|nr:VOC family protein [Agaribacter marinus]GLR70457.1 glyoxalase [Agaribacter marinus]
MIGYTTVGTDNLARAGKFYDALFANLGAKRAMQDDKFIAWVKAEDSPMFSVHIPANGQTATTGNGVMIALVAKNRAQVDEIYNQAMTLGATDEGKPGPRGDSGFYAAYFRDLDGNKLNIYCM